MQKHILLLVLSFSLLAGCAGKQLAPRHAVVLSFDSERIAYDVVGAGQTALVFIHGWSCDGRYWQKQIATFARDYKVITVDLAGHGHSSQNRSDFTMLSFAKDVKAVIEQENIDSAVLVGHSMGGAVIAEAARLMPQKVAGVIGIDTLHNVGERSPQSQIDAMAEPFENDFRSAMKNFVGSMFPQGANQVLINWIEEDMSSAPQKAAISAFRNYLNQYVTGEAATVFQGTAIPVVSINARLWPTAPEENRKHINNYKALFIEGVGHFPMLEDPEAFNALLQQAISSIESEPIEQGAGG